MTVNTIASIASSIARTSGNPTTKAAAVFTSLFNANTSSATKDVADLSAAITAQNQVAQFRLASQNIAQSSSLLAAAQQGAEAIAKDLAQMKEITARASAASLSDEERASLGKEVEVIRARIDRTANSAKFNNEALLNGSSPQLRVAQENKNIKDLSIGSMTESALFKGKAVSVATPAAAKAAEAIIKEAQAYANKQLENIKALEAGLEYAAATLQTAIQNQDASRTTLSDADLVAQLLDDKTIIGNGVNGMLAQTRLMPSNLLNLLNE